MAVAERDTRTYEIVGEKRYVFTRKLNLIDELLILFAAIVIRHCPYVLTTGSKEILKGKSEELEGFTILIPKLDEEKFSILYDEVLENDFWCVLEQDAHDAFAELTDDLGVRFAAKDAVDPTITLLFITNAEEEEALKGKIELSTEKGTLFIAPDLERGPPIHEEQEEPDQK